MSSLSTDNMLELIREIGPVQCRETAPRRYRIDIESQALATLLELLQGKASFVHLSAISCVDWIEQEQFELVYHLWSYEMNVLVSAHTRIPRDPGVYLSVFDLYPPAAFFERDIHEMYGVWFEGSPNMEKFILTEWDGPPPMRKEFDSEAYVNEHFGWQDYQPDWLKAAEAGGGGIAIRPDEQRYSRHSQADQED